MSTPLTIAIFEEKTSLIHQLLNARLSIQNDDSSKKIITHRKSCDNSDYYISDFTTLCENIRIQNTNDVTIIVFPIITGKNIKDYSNVELIKDSLNNFNAITIYVPNEEKINNLDLQFINSNCKNNILLLKLSISPIWKKINDYKNIVPLMFSIDNNFGIKKLNNILRIKYGLIKDVHLELNSVIKRNEIPVGIFTTCSFANKTSIKAIIQGVFFGSLSTLIVIGGIGCSIITGGIAIIPIIIGLTYGIASGGIIIGGTLVNYINKTLMSSDCKKIIDSYINSNTAMKNYPKKYYSSKGYKDYKYVKVDNYYFKIFGIFKKSKISEIISITQIIFQ